jgi:pantoate--beta-alanine ligase
MIPILSNTELLQKTLTPVWNSEKSIGFVPTMGALHKGHLSLLEESKKQNDICLISIFVNPLQFGENEDLDAYPRRLHEDVTLAMEHGADFVFAPNVESFYKESHQTYIHNKQVSDLYCGAYREGHFEGVLTVVSKLFHAVNPDRVYFGKKDYQQTYIIEKMLADLNWNIEVVKCATIRDKSGLALSSRNEYLSVSEKKSASIIYRCLQEVKQRYQNNKYSLEDLKSWVIEEIKNSDCKEIQYFEIVSKKTLLPVKEKEPYAIALFAGYWGMTRLIDNLEL